MSGVLAIFAITLADGTVGPVIVSCPGIAACSVIDGYGNGRT